jgi:hypothetical protein
MLSSAGRPASAAARSTRPGASRQGTVIPASGPAGGSATPAAVRVGAVGHDANSARCRNATNDASSGGGAVLGPC